MTPTRKNTRSDGRSYTTQHGANSLDDDSGKADDEITPKRIREWVMRIISGSGHSPCCGLIHMKDSRGPRSLEISWDSCSE
jgi:hypothetical protein